MSTRYIWEKCTDKFLDSIPESDGSLTWYAPHSEWPAGISYIAAYSGYTFNENTGVYRGTGTPTYIPASAKSDKAQGVTVWSPVTQSNGKNYLISADGKNVYYANINKISFFDKSEDLALWGMAQYSGDVVPESSAYDPVLRWLDQSEGQYEANSFRKYKAVTLTGANFIEYVTGTSSTKYPHNNYSGEYYYGYKMEDKPDADSIAYSATELEAGQNITITIKRSANLSVNAKDIWYNVQMSVNGGSWKTVGKAPIYVGASMAHSVNFTTTIPLNSNSVQFRVYAEDSYGFTSSTYTTGSILTKKLTVLASVSPDGGGTVSGAGEYSSGTSVTVKATPADGWEFVEWQENGAAVSTSAAYTFTINTNRSLTAVFKQKLMLWVGVNGKARKGVELYVGVNGKARKVTAAYIGVNGKARRFL